MTHTEARLYALLIRRKLTRKMMQSDHAYSRGYKKATLDMLREWASTLLSDIRRERACLPQPEAFNLLDS